MASQMKPAVYDTMAVNIKANDYDFKANGQNLKFKGFMILYVEGTDEKEEQEEGMLPTLDENQEVKLIKINPKQSFTEPPARYTEASLVKALEEKGIGRPSTYSPTITTILERRYIEKKQKQLVPTELGKIVNKLLTENFADIVNVEFTAKIENEFDEIAEGKEKWKKTIREFYGPFKQELEKAEKELEHVQLVDEVSDVKCDKCGRMMVYKYGRYGKFLACPGFPECRNIKPIVETIDVPCPKCGAKCESDQSFCVVCGAPLYSNGDNETVNNIDLNNDDLSATRIVSGISPDLNATKTNIDLHKKDGADKSSCTLIIRYTG